MKLIILAKSPPAKVRLLALASSNGVEIDINSALSRVFIAHWPDVETFPLLSEDDIDAIEIDTSTAVPPIENLIVLANDFTGGNWAALRHIRRRAPWNVDRIKTPISSFYRSIRDGAGVDVYAVEGPTRLSHQEFSGRLTRIFGDGTDGANSLTHGTAAFSLAIGDTVGFARGSLAWLSEWGDYTIPAMINACGAVLSHYNGRAATNRPAVCWVADQRTTGSLGYQSAIADMIDAGIVTVSVAGNFGDDMAVSPRYPGVYTDVICVGGLMAADIPYYTTANKTGYGDRVDILSGANRLYSADFASDTGYLLFGGTSGAEPMVAGVIACMLQGKSRLTSRSQVQAVKAKLLSNATAGRLRDQPQFGIPIGALPDRILYLDPDATSEFIAGVT